ncbi:MAG: IMP dehydrogenase [Candidatus Yanofskybacteria bacterium]|nr:IMP dehydrogenase [Candidatus Yanofskybacteria bacterium]
MSAKNAKLENIFRGAAYGDFLFEPQFGIVKTRRVVDLTMLLSRNLFIKTPIVGANMDTVTREKMMQTLSLEGCFGFLDRNCSIDDQVERVRFVKRQHAFVIENPIVLAKTNTIAEAKQFSKINNVSSILIEDKTGSKTLVGILSHRDILAAEGKSQQPISNFMTPFPKLIVAKPNVSIIEAEKIMLDSRVEKLPLIDGARQIRGLITMRDLRMVKQKPYSTKDKKGKLVVGAAVGAVGDFMDRSETLIKAGVDCILMDVAHAHSAVIKNAVRNFKSKFTEIDLVCGNIATGSAAKFLIDLGVDAVKVGIGPGKGCRTRLETGAGVPQIQAIRNVFLAIKNKVPIIADGGVNNDKDIFLAIAAGASTVMLGSMLSGTDEAPGILVEDPATKQKYKFYRGMTSPEAVVDGVVGDNFEKALGIPAEGQSSRAPYVGSVVDIINRIRGHLQSAVSYAGEKDLYSAHKKISTSPEKYLIRLSEAAKRESFER